MFSFSRVFGRAAFVCVVVASSLATVFASHAAASTVADVASTSSADLVTKNPRTVTSEKTSLASDTRTIYSSAPVTLHTANVGDDSRDLLAFPPAKIAGAHPLTVVYLHGVHGRADKGCPYLRGGASELGWLVCPEAVENDGNGTWSWGGDVFKQSKIVSNAIHTAQAQGASTEPGVAVGFSQGSYVALDLVKTHLGSFRGLVLLAAPEAHPSAQKLHDAGIKRVALGAGSLDGSYAALKEDVLRLRGEGMDARFFDLGKVGHTYAAEDTHALRTAIAWVGGIDAVN